LTKENRKKKQGKIGQNNNDKKERKKCKNGLFAQGIFRKKL